MKTVFLSFTGLAVLALLALPWPGLPAAAELDCQECHDDVVISGVHQDAAECADCHVDVVDDSHQDQGAQPVDCGECHEEYTEAGVQDVHHRLKERVDGKAPECVDCHGSHGIRAPSESQNLTADYCSRCHENIVLANTFHRLNPIPAEECEECHDEVAEFQVELGGSVHREFACGDCHAYVESRFEEHQEGTPFLQLSDCNYCHRRETVQHRESIHGISIAEGIDEAANCWNCHGSHRVLNTKDPQSKVYPVNLAETCGTCHDDPALVAKFEMGVKDPGKLYSQSVHGQLVKKGRMDAANCALCHGVHDIKNRIQPGSPISSFNVPDTCGLCHGEIELAYQQSIHWVRAKKGVKDSPVCNDCHSEHSIHAINTLDKAREVRRVQEDTCFNCHQNPLLARRYSITGDRAHQYRDSYHGMAALRGDPDAALCIDCHGEHKILPSNHRESTVNDQNVVATCRKCHPNANLTFAKSYSHATSTEPSLRIESWVEWIYIALIWMVIGGMLLHNAVVFGFEVRRHRRRAKEAITLPRFTPGEVAQHAILTLAFLVLVVTGFALTYSGAWVFGWLNLLGMSETVRQYTHRTAGVVLLATGFYHVGYMVSTRRGRFLLGRLWVGPGDLGEAVNNILYHLRLRSRPPEAEQFDYTEKAEYWALIWGTAVMGVTGFILWYPTLLGQYGPVWLIKVSEIVHFYEAVLATLAILVWHGFYVMLHPREYPLSFTMVDGRISLAHFREHHRRSYDRIVAEYRAMRAGSLPRERLSYDTAWLLEALERNHLAPEEVFRAE